MAGIFAFAALKGRRLDLLRASLWLVCGGCVLAAVFRTADLGRPGRVGMLFRTFKWRSPISVGAWALLIYGPLAAFALLLVEWIAADKPSIWGMELYLLTVATLLLGLLGAVVGTYSGVLLATSAVPVWSAFRRLLPLHFGVAGLGSAAAALELMGFRMVPLWLIGAAVSVAEIAIGLRVELRRKDPAAQAARREGAGLLIRLAALLCGPLALGLRLVGWAPLAAVAFLLGALVGRYGWQEAGRLSVLELGADPGQEGAVEGDTGGAG
jgi:hypothetical protein